MSIKIQAGFALVCFLLVSCSPTPTAILSNVPTEFNSPATSIPTILATGTIPPATLPIFPSSTPAQVSQFWFRIVSPLDETVVNVPHVDVIGSAPANTVVSINDDILIVGMDGQFKTAASLEEGPNLIEIIASDGVGNEASILLTITYEP